MRGSTHASLYAVIAAGLCVLAVLTWWGVR